MWNERGTTPCKALRNITPSHSYRHESGNIDSNWQRHGNGQQLFRRVIIKVCLLVRPTTIRLRCRQQPSLSRHSEAGNQLCWDKGKAHAAAADCVVVVDDARADASTTITSSRRKYSTVYAFYEQRITRNLILISFWRTLTCPPSCLEIYVQWSNGPIGEMASCGNTTKIFATRIWKVLARKSGKASLIPVAMVKRVPTGLSWTFPLCESITRVWNYGRRFGQSVTFVALPAFHSPNLLPQFQISISVYNDLEK